MPLGNLPTEILYAISQDVAAFGTPQLVGLTRASRQLHAVANPVLYFTDVQASDGLRSMFYGLKVGLNSVVKLCLSAGADPDLRIKSPKDLAACIFPKRQPEDSQTSLERNISKAFDDSYHGVIESHTRRSSRYYWSPLHVAATRDDLELLALLLDYGANPNSAGRGVCHCHARPLRRTLCRPVATPQDAVEVLERDLVTRWSPLHVAICEGSLDCAEQLVHRFGLPQAIESDNLVLKEARRLFHQMERASRRASGRRDLFPDSITDLAPRFDPIPPLHVAAGEYSSVEALERVYGMLKQAGCFEGPHSGVDVLDDFGNTPFAVSAFSGRAQIFGAWFRDHGADINFALHDVDGRRRSVFNALCRSGLFKDALFLMDMGADLDWQMETTSGYRYETPLHMCCGYGAWKYEAPLTEQEKEAKQREAMVLMKRLIRAGVDIEIRTTGGTTALMIAVNRNFTAAVRELLEANANVQALDFSDASPLHYAVSNGLEQKPGPGLSAALMIIQVLLNNGADPNKRSGERAAPLFSSQYRLEQVPGVRRKDFNPGLHRRDGARNNMASIAPLLIARGADPNIYLKDVRDPGNGSLEDQLRNIGGKSLALSAFYEGEFDSLDSLVASGTFVTRHHYLLMMSSLIQPKYRSYGSSSGAVESLFRILNCSSSGIRQEDGNSILDDWTEMLYDAVGSRPSLVHVLAPHVSSANICGPGGKTVLHLMAYWKQKTGERRADFRYRIHQTMTDLFRCGAGRQINQPDQTLQSPLYTAIDRGNGPVAEALVDFGASIHMEQGNPDGSIVESPLRLAIKSYSDASRHKAAVGILELYCSKHRSENRCCGSVGLLNDLILHFRDNPFDKPARMASRTLQLMEKLIDLGVDVNESDRHGNTALHLLFEMLCPSDKGPDDSGGSQAVAPPQSSYIAIRRSVGAKCAVENGSKGLDAVPEALDETMNGHNIAYDSDSDYGDGTRQDSDGYSEDMIGGRDDSDSDSDSDSDDESNRDKSKSEENLSRKDYNWLALDRCRAWISSFFFLVSHHARFTLKNNAGKTALDYIDELKSCDVNLCPSMYRSVIPALRDFVKRPPFEAEVVSKSANLDRLENRPIGEALVLIHDHIHFGLDDDGREAIHDIDFYTGEKGGTRWLAFWQ